MKRFDTLKTDRSNNFFNFLNIRMTFFSRADCSKVDLPGVEPEHNGLTQFGRVRFENCRVILFYSDVVTADYPLFAG